MALLLALALLGPSSFSVENNIHNRWS